MKKHIKKHISLLLAALLIISAAAMSSIAFADDNAEINAENFPDQNFRDAISLMYDVDSNGVLSKQERNIDSMILSGIIEMLAFENDLDEDSLFVNDLKGIEYFDNLKSLRCSSVGNITSLDISALDKLETLACNDLGLEELNLSNATALKVVNACSNDFESLDFSDNINLERIHCYSNEKLKSINVNGLTKLSNLRCDGCAIESLDLSTNTALSDLNCSYNKLTTLDLSANTNLTITEYNVGFQEGSAQATAQDSVIVVPFELDAARVMRTSLDKDETVAYSDGFFYTDDFDNMSGGLTYYYNTGISDSALMSVHLDVTELAHIYELCGYDFDKNCADIKCVICKDDYKVNFIDVVNTRLGNKKFNELLDINKDGIINAKDYSAILKEYYR